MGKFGDAINKVNNQSPSWLNEAQDNKTIYSFYWCNFHDEILDWTDKTQSIQKRHPDCKLEIPCENCPHRKHQLMGLSF